MNLPDLRKTAAHLWWFFFYSTQTNRPEVWIFSFRKLYLDILPFQM